MKKNKKKKHYDLHVAVLMKTRLSYLFFMFILSKRAKVNVSQALL